MLHEASCPLSLPRQEDEAAGGGRGAARQAAREEAAAAQEARQQKRDVSCGRPAECPLGSWTCLPAPLGPPSAHSPAGHRFTVHITAVRMAPCTQPGPPLAVVLPALQAYEAKRAAKDAEREAREAAQVCLHGQLHGAQAQQAQREGGYV